MSIFSENSPLMRFLGKMGDFMILNLVFVFSAFPLFTLGASLTALYRVTILRAKGDDSSIPRLFWKAFRTNFRQATTIELIMLFFAALVCMDLYLLYTGIAGESLLIVILCLMPLAIFLMIHSYVYPLLAWFENTVGHTIKNAFMLAIGNFPTTLAVTVLNLSPVIILAISRELFQKSVVLWVLLGFAVIAWINERLLHRVFKLFIPGNGEETVISE